MFLMVNLDAINISNLPVGDVPIILGAVNTSLLANVLYTSYVYPFELASVILLVAIISAIMLTLRQRKGAKYQNVAEQVLVCKRDRLKVIKNIIFPTASKLLLKVV